MKKISASCFHISLFCLVAAVALASLDTFPFWNISYFPDRPSYFFALAGLGFWLASGRWFREAARHKTLVGLVLAALLWSTFATVCGSLQRKPGHLVFDYLFFFLNWRVWPLLFLLWSGLVLATCPRERIIRLFSWGFGLLFLQNLVHGLLEILANCGIADVKAFLSDNNHLIRKEKVAHGWWPPVFFEGRVRGLFAEPSHMTFSLTPLWGYFTAKRKENRLYVVPLAGLVLLYGFSKSDTGFLEVAAFFLLLFACSTHVHPRVRRLGWAGILALCVLAGGAATMAWTQSPELRSRIAGPIATIVRIPRYCAAIHAGDHPPVPHLDYSREIHTSAVSRLTAMGLDLEAALASPLVGLGFFQKGFSWDPLAACDFQQSEFGLWVTQGLASPFREVPQISEYTTLAAEFGFPGLALFALLYAFIGVRALRFARQQNDRLVLCLGCAYWAMLVGALFISLINGVLFFYFSGFLYALSTPHLDAAQAALPSSPATQ